MNDRIVSDVAYSLLSRAERDRLQIGTTRLVKLLYLIDCDYFKWKRETLTGAAWVFYHYGPYSAELIDVVNRAPGVTVAELDDLEDGRSFRRYSISSFRGDPLEMAAPEVRGIVQTVYKKWAAIDLNLLLDHVYFATAPMLAAQRSEPLDFNQISSATEPTPEPILDFSTIIPKDKRQAVLSQIRHRREARVHSRAAWHLNLDESDLEDLKRLEEDNDVSPPLEGLG